MASDKVSTPSLVHIRIWLQKLDAYNIESQPRYLGPKQRNVRKATVVLEVRLRSDRFVVFFILSFFEFYLETTSTSTMGKPTYLVLLNLLVATLVAAEEGENCPFKKLVKCKRLDSQDSQFPPTEVTMVKGSASVAYTCNSEIRFKKLNLDRLSYKDVCETFYYDFDGDYLRMSMKPIKESKHNTIISAEHTEKGIWQVNTEAQLHRVGRVRMRIQFDIGREKLMVPTMFKRQLTEEYQERKKITFIFREAGSKRPSFIMAMFPDKIEYHDDDTWIFGRAAMELFKLSFTRVANNSEGKSHIKALLPQGAVGRIVLAVELLPLPLIQVEAILYIRALAVVAGAIRVTTVVAGAIRETTVVAGAIRETTVVAGAIRYHV
ncbi:hypothetical protein ABG067_005410 [Albugo candida]